MDATWKVGAVAETSGLTVRTLHHWDEIGLLTPSRRGPGGHREYTGEDLGRLYVVLVLRDLGLPLESIRACLEARVDPRRVLADQLKEIDAAVAGLQRLRERVARAVDTGISADPAELLTLRRDARPRARAVLEAHLSPEERDALSRAGAAAGPALPYLLEIEWPRLYRQADELRRAGAAPRDARVQRIVTRLDELSALVSGGREGAGAGVRAAWRADPAAMSGEPEAVAGPWRELADFVEQARASG
jgi:DNA-binding transcriptional MerR regulator